MSNTFAAAWKSAFRRRLLAWYRRNARDLPWRGTRDPYLVWVSEIMLQQTQVATVRSYYTRFIAKFPTLQSLAAAKEDDVLRLWEGLGYYRRARQLHRAAQVIVAEHGGQFPRDPAAIRNLPGIGRYTAGAILSIAFDRRQPILEANTLRLLARLAGHRGDPTSSAGQALLWAAAEELLPRTGAGTFNQALMELGSLICTPREPRCEACPAIILCPTYRQGLQAKIPPPKRKPKIEQVREAVIVVRRRGDVLLIRRQEPQRWAGLWDFVRFPVNGVPAAGSQLIAEVRQCAGISIHSPRPLLTLRHGVTRFRITLDCYEADSRGGRAASVNGHQQWVPVRELDAYPLSVTGRKIAVALTHLGNSSRSAGV